jgi:sugar/nucleoside kinase (ribokinase family)
MSEGASPDLLVFGNLIVDDVVFPDGRTRMSEPGGAVLYLGLAAALSGARTGVVSVQGDDYPRDALAALSSHGVDLAGIRPANGPSLRTWLLYEGRRRRVVHRLEGPSHADASPRPADVPSGWQAARAWHLAPMPLDIQRSLLRAARRSPDTLVSLDPYLMLSEETLDDLRPLIDDVDVLFVSEDELELSAPADDPLRSLRELPRGRLRYLVFKRGPRGGLVWDARERRSHAWSAHPGPVIDPTGAGDAFAAGFLAGFLAAEDLSRALRRGAVAASFAVRAWGAAGLVSATPGELARELGG